MTGREATDRPVRVALIGLGWVARTVWLPLLIEYPDFDVVALVDPEPAATREAGRIAPDARALPDTDMLSREDVDLAMVAVPNYLHATTAANLLVKGLAVFLEKPVCLNSAELSLLRDAEIDGGGLLMACGAARHRADVQQMLHLVRGLGPVRAMHLSWVRARGVPQPSGWFTRRVMAGGGALIDLGWHLLDTGMMLLGWPDVTQAVGALSADFVGDPAFGAGWRRDSAPDPGSGDVEDTARGFLITADDVAVSLRASWASHEPLDTTVIAVDAVDGSAELRCTFGFSPSRLPESTLTVTRRGERIPVAIPEEPVGTEYRRQLAELLPQLTDPRARGAAVREAAPTVAAVEQLYRSARPNDPSRQAVSAAEPAGQTRRSER